VTDQVATTLTGHGVLHRTLADRWGDRPPAGFGVTVGDVHPATPPSPADQPWLAVWSEHFQVVVGPLIVPGRPGCLGCLALRRARARDAATERLWNAFADDDGFSTTVPPLAVAAVAALVERRDGERDGRAYEILQLSDLSVRRHTYLPDPLCPDCGDLPPDRPRDAILTLRSRPKPASGSYRLRTAEQLHPILTATYVDDDAGVVPRVERGDEAGFTVARAEVRLRTRDDRRITEAGWGRADDYRTSDVVALLEALERWGGMQPGGRRTEVYGSYAELSQSALDPRTFGLAGRDVPAGGAFQRFDPAVRCHWVWGYSFARAEPVLVPEGHAYYGIRLTRPDEPRFADEISNGCAIGSCLEEAVLHGLFEVAERDGFLLTWYARMARRPITLDTTTDRAEAELAARIRNSTGYDVRLFEITAEYGLPAVWAMAVHPDESPEDAKAVCSAAAHLDPWRAVRSALQELGPVLSSVRRSWPEHRERVRTMVDDADLVTRMTDHSLLYADACTFPRFAFLFGPATPIRVDEMSGKLRPTPNLSDDLNVVIGSMLAEGLDVVVVDQTTPEHRAAGLSCVKVLVPGTIPMSFGNGNRRTQGLPRLYTVPHRLGQDRPPVSEADLNPFPHPFA
jgi:ribosomal protein S12 methylthiotransferase accessory factor